MSIVVRAVRGATTLENDEAGHLTERVQEMVQAVYQANELQPDDVVSIFFTATSDIRSKFPASAARELGLDDVPLLGAQELEVENATPLCIRLMLHVNTTKSRQEITHVFLHGAQLLRQDLIENSNPLKMSSDSTMSSDSDSPNEMPSSDAVKMSTGSANSDPQGLQSIESRSSEGQSNG